MRIRTVARRLPRPIRHTLKAAYNMIPPRFRLGRAFWGTYDFLQRSQWWDSDRLQEYQMREVERLLAHCYTNVPYYRRCFDEHGLKPADIQSLSDLRRLPCLRKEQIRKEPGAFAARNRRTDGMELRYTTGTTGEPFQFYVDQEELQREWAFACHLWRRVGYEPGQAQAELRGKPLIGSKPYSWDSERRALRLSPTVREKNTVRLYLDTMQSYGIRFLYGYPSAVTHFASLVRRYGLRPEPELTAVLFASEMLYPWQRALVEEVFGCRTYNFYGLAEHAVIAGECEASHAFHCMPQYGVTEIDPQTGEITGTGFLNYVNPFVRYRTTDVASLPVLAGCSRCGRQYDPVLPHIEGRVQEYIATPDGTYLCSCTLTFPFREKRTISRVQIVQEALDRVTLRAAPVHEDSRSMFLDELTDARRILQGMLGQHVTIRNEMIPPEECMGPGKFRFIVSHLPDHLRCGGTSGP